MFLAYPAFLEPGVVAGFDRSAGYSGMIPPTIVTLEGDAPPAVEQLDYGAETLRFPGERQLSGYAVWQAGEITRLDVQRFGQLNKYVFESDGRSASRDQNILREFSEGLSIFSLSDHFTRVGEHSEGKLETKAFLLHGVGQDRVLGYYLVVLQRKVRDKIEAHHFPVALSAEDSSILDNAEGRLVLDASFDGSIAVGFAHTANRARLIGRIGRFADDQFTTDFAPAVGELGRVEI